MKRFKLLFALLAVVTVAAGTLAFTAAKKYAVVTYYFVAPSSYIGTSADELVAADVTDPFYYTTVQPNITLGAGNYLAGIKFDEAQISLTAAISAVWSTYSPAKTLPAHNASFNAGSVTTTVDDVTILRKIN